MKKKRRAKKRKAKAVRSSRARYSKALIMAMRARGKRRFAVSQRRIAANGKKRSRRNSGRSERGIAAMLREAKTGPNWESMQAQREKGEKSKWLRKTGTKTARIEKRYDRDLRDSNK